MEFILLLLSFLLLSSRVTSSSDAVLDSDGNELQSGQLYYAESVYSMGGAGGLRMESPQGQRCPLYVAKGSFNDVKGQPLMFFPENKKDDIVRVERTLYIKFAEPTPCAESTTWRLDNNNNAVVTGGTTSSKVGPHDSRFALYRTNLGYKIRPCPCSNGVNRPSCRMECSGHLGVVEGKLERQLGVNDIPHEFRLMPAKRGEIEFVTRSEV
uniref:Trypsin/chymotrypsin inhibitor n=1 Tax=Anthurium amnicola TaxID=1678845 RepID=A0A1D1YTI6_9ARAE